MKKILLLIFFTASLSLNAQWNQQTTVGVMYSISAVNNTTAWACGPGSSIIRTTNGGQNWVTVNPVPVNITLYNIFAIDANTALVTGSGGFAYVWKTTNGGGNWTQVLIQENGFLNAVHINPDGTGILTGDPVPIGGRWSLWRTTNFGNSWDSSGMRVPAINYEFGFQNALHVNGTNYYFGSSDNRIYVSTNSGANWTARTTSIQGSYNIWFNGTTGIVGGISIVSPGVTRSTNSGTSWSAVTVPTTNPVGGLVGDGTTFWIARGSVIYVSTNNGITWAVDFNGDSPLTGSINHMCKARTGNKLWAVTSTGNIYYSDGVLSGVSGVLQQVPKRFMLFQNYPNPFNPVTNFGFQIADPGFVKLAIFDVTGKEVETLQNGPMKPGVYKAEWNASNYPSGVYFYTITTDNYNETRKMILVK